MKKSFLIRINAILGALSVLLAGCHSAKKAVPLNPDNGQKDAPGEVICMYGIPPYLLEEPIENDSIPQPLKEEQQDNATKQEEDRIIRVKYGVPPNLR